ncbi:MAG: hypothetical protein ACFE0I_18575 [Elainellaceae cyanobacterium]
MPNYVSERPSSKPAISQATFTNISIAPADSRQNGRNALEESTRLPYQADHQAEFLYLKADIDALLAQLQVLNQQRLAEPSSTLSRPAERS